MQIPAFIALPGDAPAMAARSTAPALARRWLARFHHRLAQRRTLRELRQLDDATLRDIGVTRWQLDATLASDRARAELLRVRF